MQLQLIRHATLLISYAGLQILVDPMLSGQGENPPVPNSANDRRNPLVPLPMAAEELLAPDAVLVTHLHPDHWDAAARGLLPKHIPIWCQPCDEQQLTAQGFARVTPVESREVLLGGGIELIRTGGQHGTGEIGKLMGQVSGFVLRAPGEPVLYIAGDTIWCEEVQQALDTYRPDVTVLNAGGAQFVHGDPITMNEADVVRVCRHAPYTRIAAVHMEAINHCFIDRSMLQEHLRAEELDGQVVIPADGETIRF